MLKQQAETTAETTAVVCRPMHTFTFAISMVVRNKQMGRAAKYLGRTEYLGGGRAGLGRPGPARPVRSSARPGPFLEAEFNGPARLGPDRAGPPVGPNGPGR